MTPTPNRPRPRRPAFAGWKTAGSRLDAVPFLLLRRRGPVVLLLPIADDDPILPLLEGVPPSDIAAAVVAGDIQDAWIVGTDGEAERAPGLAAAIRAEPELWLTWFNDRQPPSACGAEGDAYFDRLQRIGERLSLLDFFAPVAGGRQVEERDGRIEAPPVPFDKPDGLPPYAPAAPRRRSALFLHNAYYHFNCLSEGLRRRGWDTVTVSLASPEDPRRRYWHGEDINLFHADPIVMEERVRAFFRTVPERFAALHFYGMGTPGFFWQNFENSEAPRRIPWDVLELRRHGTIIGFSPSGCLDGARQSSIDALAGGLCGRCVWQERPDVCSDARSMAWNRKLAAVCDWVCLEGDYGTPERVSRGTVYGPVTATLDPDRWHPALDVPEDMRVERSRDTVLIYHGVGSLEARRIGARDIKGTGAVLAAVGRLEAEGLPVRLVFAEHVPSTRVRFLQVQADIVVDQLNYGRYGANARECMMLGRPTLCRLNPVQEAGLPPLRPILEAPLVHADEETVYSILRSLVLDPQRRQAIGRRSREFALSWHGTEACAWRYERVIERIAAGLPPEADELYPSRCEPHRDTDPRGASQ